MGTSNYTPVPRCKPFRFMPERPRRLPARRVRGARWGIALLLGAACAAEDVQWSDATTPLALPSARARLSMASTGAPVAVVPPEVADPVGACAGSVRAAARGPAWFMAWWSPGANGNVRLHFSRSTNRGENWSVPVVVETRDRGTRGCNRPALALSLGEASEYLHLTYWIEPADGAGVFFTHSMDAGGMFHAPVAVAYGAVPARVDVASVGDTVVVAHEDPNSATPRLRVAVSRTAGHIFEQRFAVPAEGVPQSDPRVALKGDRIYVGWLTAAGQALVVRSGVLKKQP